MKNKKQHFEVIIVGGGITGSALAYVLSEYTSVGSIALFERGKNIGAVNTDPRNNSQTLHDGSIETNYTREKAEKVKKATDLMASYLEAHAPADAFRYEPKHLLGVGDEEVAIVNKRYEDFKDLYPDLECIGPEEIARREPAIMAGRDPKESVIALATKGYTIDFRKVAESFVDRAKNTGKCSLFMETAIVKAEKKDGIYVLTDSNGTQYTAKVVVFATGPYSLVFAKSLGLEAAKHLGIVQIAGSFYETLKQFLLNKWYTVQKAKLPFAAVHGDPEIFNELITRFGPTAMVSFLLEYGKLSSIVDYFRASVPTWDGVATLLGILTDRTMGGYMLHNMLYEIPIVGKWFFLQTARKIVPTLQYEDLIKHEGKGFRSQVVNTITRKLEMGDARLIGDNMIANITPSPGASVGLANGYRDALQVMSFFGGEFAFDAAKWEEDYTHHPDQVELD